MITTEQLNVFLSKLNAVNAEYYTRTMPTFPGYFDGITMSIGKKNAKFITSTAGQRSVLLFVELETGNILKAAGWNAPAKGNRGNILTTEPQPMTGWLYAR